jgi:1-acyl-sn-glycerol-3-phosphate acyltransferase
MDFPGQIAGELPATRPTANARLNKQPNVRPSENVLYGKTLYHMGRSLMAVYMRFMLNVDIRWHAPLPEGPKILAPNHPTTTDPLYLLPLLPEPVSFVVTAASFDVPVVGAYLRAAGNVPAIRGSGGATVDTIVRQVEAGRSVAIFPEGALSPLAGGFHRPHSGVARVALRTGAPVIPVGIGLQRDRIRVTEAQVDGDKAIGHFYLGGPYAITVGRPLTFAGDVQDRERVRAAAAHIMDHIRNLARQSERRVARAPVAAPQPGASPVEAL